MEPRFGRDLSHIRVHSDDRAAESARAIGASAYAKQHDIVFDLGRYVPHTSSGRELLAHELAHTIQQTPSDWKSTRKSTVGSIPRIDPGFEPNTIQIGAADSPAELEAASIAQSVVRHGQAGSFLHHDGPLVRRQPNPNAPQHSKPEDFGITLAVVDHGASGVRGAAQAQLDEIYRSLNPTSLLQLQNMGVTRVELDVIPYDKKIIEVAEFAHLKGQKTPDGRLWDDVRGEGGVRIGSTIHYAVAEEGLSGARHSWSGDWVRNSRWRRDRRRRSGARCPSRLRSG
jgi:hypothetical protein